MPEPILLCPTTFEARLIEPRLRRIFPAAKIIGAGQHCTAVLRELTARHAAGTVAILAGIGGGLTARARAGHAYAISRVVIPDGTTVAAEWLPAGVETLPLLASDTVLSTAQVKRDAAQRTGCDLVDMESHHFIAAARRAGWRWLVVRGVSDDHETMLPGAVMNFLDSTGALRPWAIASHLLTHPWHIPMLARLRRDSAIAMGAAAAAIETAMREAGR
jgi:nucleoside phosphorylase